MSKETRVRVMSLDEAARLITDSSGKFSRFLEQAAADIGDGEAETRTLIFFDDATTAAFDRFRESVIPKAPASSGDPQG